METKQILREQYKQIRRSLSACERAAADSEIARRFFDLPAYKNSHSVMGYSALYDEAGTQKILDHVFADGKTLLLPVTNVKTETMYAAQLTSSGDTAVGGYGIAEPQNTAPYMGKIDLVIVPGLVFNKNGFRIGYGKGYYDKFLACRPETVTVGLAYSCQLCGKHFGEVHDARLNFIVTEKEVIACER